MVLKEGVVLDGHVYDSEGNVIPQFPVKDNQGNGAIHHYWMPFAEYTELEEVFCQRDTKARYNKAKGHLAVFRTEHAQVSVAKLTEDDTDPSGKKYKAGTRFITDSNTRNLIWSRGASDTIPQEVLVIEYSYDSLDDIRQSYNTFDSAESVERNQEKLHGIFQMYKFTPVSSKLQKGQILSALNKACHFYYPEEWNQTNVKSESLPGQVGIFLAEIKALDKFLISDVWDQALMCIALMALKRYGTNNTRLNQGLQDINNGYCVIQGKQKDGITQIVDEWKTGANFEFKGTGWAVLNETVSFGLYWIDKYMKDEMGAKPGRGWQNRGFEYKDQPQATDKLERLTSTVTAGFLEAGDLTIVKDEVA